MTTPVSKMDLKQAKFIGATCDDFVSVGVLQPSKHQANMSCITRKPVFSVSELSSAKNMAVQSQK